jgi:hypothetical protein
MRFRSFASLIALAGAAFVTVAAQQPPAGQAAQARTPVLSLFDGKTLKGWRGYKKTDTAGTRWTVEDGTLTLPGKARAAGDIITDETFDFFDLSWEWKISEGGNSGLKYFVLEDQNSAIGHEYQVIDDARHPDAKIGPHRQTAAFYDVLAAPGTRPIKPAGEWNTSRIRVAPNGKPGSAHVTHSLNGAAVLEYDLGSPELQAAIEKSKFKGIERFGKLQKGHILLQDHGDQVWFRNIRIQRLTPAS